MRSLTVEKFDNFVKLLAKFSLLTFPLNVPPMKPAIDWSNFCTYDD